MAIRSCRGENFIRSSHIEEVYIPIPKTSGTPISTGSYKTAVTKQSGNPNAFLTFNTTKVVNSPLRSSGSIRVNLGALHVEATLGTEISAGFSLDVESGTTSFSSGINLVDGEVNLLTGSAIKPTGSNSTQTDYISIGTNVSTAVALAYAIIGAYTATSVPGGSSNPNPSPVY